MERRKWWDLRALLDRAVGAEPRIWTLVYITELLEVSKRWHDPISKFQAGFWRVATGRSLPLEDKIPGKGKDNGILEGTETEQLPSLLCSNVHPNCALNSFFALACPRYWASSCLPQAVRNWRCSASWAPNKCCLFSSSACSNSLPLPMYLGPAGYWCSQTQMFLGGCLKH